MTGHREVRLNVHTYRKLTVASALIIATVAAVADDARAAEGPCTSYKPFFDAIHSANSSWMNSQAASGKGPTYYHFSYILGGTLAMYEGTHDVQYLERMLGWAEKMVAGARIVDDQGRKNWAGTWTTLWADVQIANMLEDLQGSTELARLARIVLTDTELRAKHGTRAQLTYRFVKDHIVDKWLYKRTSATWFRNAARDPAILYSDKLALMTRLLLDLYQIDGNAAYASLASEFLDAFKDRLDPHANSSLVWDLTVPGKAPDTAHANRIPFMLADAYEAGIEVTSVEIRGLSNLLTGVMWDRSTTSPRFTNYIDGDNGQYSGRPAWGNGLIYSGWVTLGAYDSRVQQMAKSVLKAIVANVDNPSIDYMNSVHGRIALAGYITRNMRVSNSCF
jgi:hypothetical protein